MKNERVKLKKCDWIALRIQQIIAWITLPIWYFGMVFYARFCRGYRIKELRSLRKQYKKILQSQQCPLLICANHLTNIDSLVLQWGLSSFTSNLLNFNRFAWNLPDRKLCKHNLVFRIGCYVGCCIPIDRRGDRKLVKQSLDKTKYLLQTKHSVMIFPEGRRSLIGKIDTEDYAYGVGQLLLSIKECSALCIYMRGKFQKEKSDYPASGEQFYFDLKLIKPETIYTGIRAARDLSFQVIKQLSNMEKKYFDFNWN